MTATPPSDELLALAESHDPGFDEAMFVIALRAIHRLPPALAPAAAPDRRTAPAVP